MSKVLTSNPLNPCGPHSSFFGLQQLLSLKHNVALELSIGKAQNAERLPLGECRKYT